MPKVEYNSVLITSTGPDIPVLDDSTLDIDRLVFWIVTSDGTSAGGYYDNTSKKFTGSSTYGDENSTKSLTHYRNVSGTKTKVFEMNVTALDVGEFSINTTTITANTVLHYVAYED
jgi:hypothetical protein